MIQYNFLCKTITPVFIGDGKTLRLGFDFMTNETPKKTFRLNIDTIFEDFYTPQKLDIRPGNMIPKEKRNNPRYYRYTLPGAIRSAKTDGNLQSFLKDVYDCPYIPDSSIKGAIRTALSCQYLEKKHVNLKQYVSPSLEKYGKFDPKKADDAIEKFFFGEDPRTDIFRTIQISDAFLKKPEMAPGAGLFIANLIQLSKNGSDKFVPIEMECLQRQKEFFGTMKIDNDLWDKAYEEKTEFNSKKVIIESMFSSLRAYSIKRLSSQISWFENNNCVFAKDKLNQLKNLVETQLPENYCLIQIGAGSGWDGNTYSDLLRADETWFENFLIQSKTLKSIKGVLPKREVGAPFPSSRKITLDEKGAPKWPLGWCLITFEEKQ